MMTMNTRDNSNQKEPISFKKMVFSVYNRLFYTVRKDREVRMKRCFEMESNYGGYVSLFDGDFTWWSFVNVLTEYVCCPSIP